MNSIKETNYNFKNQKAFYRGKVRDVYYIGKHVLMVASDRISAFDVVLPRPIPFKGQVLNQIAAKNLEAMRDIVPNWLIATPDPNASFGLNCETFPVEMVVRGYLAGHAWREYKSGKRSICGVELPEGIKENDRLPTPIITPTTKAHEGHDEDISREEIITKELVSEEKYKTLEKYALALFAKGTEMALQNGLILVDTKYEFGELDNKIYLIDEVHTPDSSRFFYAATYEENQKNGISQKQLSKEFVREWLIENNFQGKEGQTIPEMTDEKIEEISNRYIELYEKVTGEKFKKDKSANIIERVEKNVNDFLKQI
ncbi:phosphoribosylaminoimidazolesuccinocarboxamide synthase [Lacihabitans sp. LS3-19]|uniref:phosphoribosylaminoimidazolesuccinocarboxamide synthase n=1 Tax=Lacihabitans sp. LS3-19 TaxID=2487335 RepID=UPI0020CFB16F|nr:phosphoribosylaminoimidazolesuccinocarboxamide synthase [Lacihabitans sp. LS3-19]MCP9767461.1 phosphoribosylaminoimidazolesuccinocarboxamide synthase [Lacihabitans sp. LS3-19]